MLSMIFQAKHRIFQNTLKNLKDIKSQVLFQKKHPKSIACQWETSHSKCIKYQPMKSTKIGNEDYSDVLAQVLHVESVLQDILATNWVTFSVTEYI